MSVSETAHLELLAEVDDLVGRLTEWAAARSPWEPLQKARLVVKRLLQRVDPLRLRMDAPLVVATFGGTGVGKSTLVNALVGEDVAPAGRQRPTTREPTVLVHPETNLQSYGLPLDELRVVVRDAPLLRDLLLVDCPDPNTDEAETPGTNLEKLRRILPYCDVLLYLSTQERYRNARVVDELEHAADGCKLIFVQTRADLDSDIREDWRRQLAPRYQVAEMFFVDSRAAFAEQQQGLRPTGEFGRLLDTLFRELSAAQRGRIRQGNLFGLAHAVLVEQARLVASHQSQIAGLEAALAEQQRQLTRRLATSVQTELLESRGLWERQLMAQVTQLWGFSPWSLVLRAYHSQASLLASWTLLRARSSVQMALWGAVHGARWMASRQQETADSERLEGLGQISLTDTELQEATLIMEGHARSARLDRTALALALPSVKQSTATVEGEFWGVARRELDELLQRLARRNAGPFTRVLYEFLFALLPVYLLARIGKNFFYDSAWLGLPLLETNFYIPAALFLLLWTVTLLVLFTWRLRRGTQREVQQLAQRLAESKLAGGLFPGLSAACREFDRDARQIQLLSEHVGQIRQQAAENSGLSGRR